MQPEIQSIHAGASMAVCRQCKQSYDNRPYGTALTEEGWPLLPRWSIGDWSPECRTEAKRFLSYAINHGSLPMLLVVGLTLIDHPLLRQRLTDQLAPNEYHHLIRLLRIGETIDKRSALTLWRLQIQGEQPCIPNHATPVEPAGIS